MLAPEFIDRISQHVEYVSIDIEKIDFGILKNFLESSKGINLISLEFSLKKSRLQVLRLAEKVIILKF
jgi:hypothetical protein